MSASASIRPNAFWASDSTSYVAVDVCARRDLNGRVVCGDNALSQAQLPSKDQSTISGASGCGRDRTWKLCFASFMGFAHSVLVLAGLDGAPGRVERGGWIVVGRVDGDHLPGAEVAIGIFVEPPASTVVGAGSNLEERRIDFLDEAAQSSGRT